MVYHRLKIKSARNPTFSAFFEKKLPRRVPKQDFLSHRGSTTTKATDQVALSGKLMVGARGLHPFDLSVPSR